MCQICPDGFCAAYLSGEGVLENLHLNSTSASFNDVLLKGSWLKSKSGVSLLRQEGQCSPEGKEKKKKKKYYALYILQEEPYKFRCNI